MHNPHPMKPQFTGVFDDIIKAVAVAIPFIKGKGASGQAKGLQAIRQATSQVLQQMDQFLQEVASLGATERYQNANAIMGQMQQLNDVLYNHSAIYQAKNGQDAEVLKQAKNTAQQKLEQMRSLLQSGTATSGNGTGQQQVIVNPDGTQTIIQIPAQNNTLIYGGIGLLALFLLMRKK